MPNCAVRRSRGPRAFPSPTTCRQQSGHCASTSGIICTKRSCPLWGTSRPVVMRSGPPAAFDPSRVSARTARYTTSTREGATFIVATAEVFSLGDGDEPGGAPPPGQCFQREGNPVLPQRIVAGDKAFVHGQRVGDRRDHGDRKE